MKIPNPFKRRQKPVEQKSWTLTSDEGWMDKSWDLGWWQQDRKPGSGAMNETVEACVSTLAQTVAMCPIYLLERQEDGEMRRLVGANPERTLLNPNDYFTRSLLFNTLVRSVYFYGNGYAVATRDDRGAVAQLHPVDPRNMNGVIDPETGEVFYWVSQTYNGKYNPDTDQVYMPRDVLNLRLHPNRQDPLKGDTPITVAANAIAANSAITSHQAKFFSSMSRPSGILSTPDKLTKEQMLQLREAVAAQTQGVNSGKVPILGSGLKFESMSLTSQDSQMVEAFGMGVESISRVFRVPLPLINALNGSTYANAESTMNWFLASGMGFLLEHIELELNRLFGLPFKQRLNFDTKVLLRSDWKSQIETLGEGVLKGIYSPNEARKQIGLPPAIDGDEPRVQQQVVPLSAWDQSANEPIVEPEPEPEPEPDQDEVEAALLAGITKGMSNG